MAVQQLWRNISEVTLCRTCLSLSSALLVFQSSTSPCTWRVRKLPVPLVVSPVLGILSKDAMVAAHRFRKDARGMIARADGRVRAAADGREYSDVTKRAFPNGVEQRIAHLSVDGCVELSKSEFYMKSPALTSKVYPTNLRRL